MLISDLISYLENYKQCLGDIVVYQALREYGQAHILPSDLNKLIRMEKCTYNKDGQRIIEELLVIGNH